ncbi:serine/threonine-protein kinase pim-3-like [Amphiura filiformis]|uniref:serine/threonine-protein kinase pim-3-like n=1 Tax=Amphiura filiformis TaxID=82378 RepID=UPI003B20EAC7
MKHAGILKYRIDEQIGEGAFGVVLAGKRLSDDLPVAIKRVEKRDATIDEFILLQKVKGVPGCVQLLEFIEDKSTCYYVMERPDNCMDLLQLICSDEEWDEDTCRDIFGKMVQATISCHKAGVLHRDLSEDNFLIDLGNDTVQLIDFGGGALLHDGEYTAGYGINIFAPPEWLTKETYHGVPATVWSLGITLFSMAFQDFPFKNTDEVCRGELHFPDIISPSLEELLKSMLSIEPENRPKLAEILNHKWLKEDCGK